MIFGFAVISVSSASLRAEPSHRSEQISQLLFGEKIIVLSKTKKGWYHVKCEWDKYDGWLKESQTFRITENEYKKTTNALSCSLQDFLIQENGRTLLSPGSSLYLLRGKYFKWENTGLQYKGKKLSLRKTQFEEESFIRFCKLFIGSPYQWGGRSVFGIDCSGYTQIVFKLFNYRISRDAAQQAKEGDLIDFLQESKCGDLAFFDNDEGQINHVGILLDPQTIIHATDTSGCVVIDAIDSNGIISKKLKARTHNLRLIKRYF